MTHHSLLLTVISGGQTGVDRAALDVAIELGIPCSGWCPKGRLAEDGQISARYPLTETATAEFSVRTELNVLHSDGTLILTWGEPSGGTLFTRQCAQHHRKPCFESDLQAPTEPAQFHHWLTAESIQILNIAGPRESHRSGQVYVTAKKVLYLYLGTLRQDEI
jgi:Circularly permutated YpsA SLOG family